MMGTSGGPFVRSVLRAILSLALLFGSGVGDWASAPTGMQNHESCCCGTPASTEDSCPCPRPEGNRTPTSTPCTNRTVAVASVAVRRNQSERRVEPRPEPAAWAMVFDIRALAGIPILMCGRDPDLGRHLARLNTLLI